MSAVDKAKERSIGEASMDADGTITLQLRATGSGGPVGDGLLRIRPGDPNYAATLTHLDGLEPGQRKPVRPWPGG